MSNRTLRRRLREAMAGHDWLEGASVVLGFVFLILAALCVWAIVAAIASWGDPAAPLDAEGTRPAIGFLKVTRGFGILLFTLFGFLALGVGWFLAGDWIRLRIGRRRA